MSDHNKKVKAIALFSGGLDSVLAIKLVAQQGIEVIALNINTGFGSTKNRLEHMQNMCKQLNVELMIIDIESEYLQDVLFDPKHGYGKNFNPCIDCHAKMFEVAKRVMDEKKATFLISGEVLGQRPMSQNKDALAMVLNDSNCGDILLRPLSAKKLSPTKVEIDGIVDRDQLEGIVGRNRDRQLELAKEMGLKDFESPGGGCLLTDINFAKKMFDFIKYDKFEVKDIAIMKYGRHLRLKDGAKLVVGRNQEENGFLQDIQNNKYFHIKTIGIPGPHSLLSKMATDEDKKLAASIILTYCKTSYNESYKLSFDSQEVTSSPFKSRDMIQPYIL